ncbi:hypothetical protein V8G54_007861 [Vigna mungo]|uniref:Uncharacterized protein n=1 Tax=Vigna mungo TaxID=3915 RepID=A0AAQ3S9H1_VIGMU
MSLLLDTTRTKLLDKMKFVFASPKFAFSFPIYSLNCSSCSDNGITEASCAVKGSYPAPPEAKLIPFNRSSGCKFGLVYATEYSLIPNSSATKSEGTLPLLNLPVG